MPKHCIQHLAIRWENTSNGHVIEFHMTILIFFDVHWLMQISAVEKKQGVPPPQCACPLPTNDIPEHVAVCVCGYTHTTGKTLQYDTFLLSLLSRQCLKMN